MMDWVVLTVDSIKELTVGESHKWKPQRNAFFHVIMRHKFVRIFELMNEILKRENYWAVIYYGTV